MAANPGATQEPPQKDTIEFAPNLYQDAYVLQDFGNMKQWKQPAAHKCVQEGRAVNTTRISKSILDAQKPCFFSSYDFVDVTGEFPTENYVYRVIISHVRPNLIFLC